MTILLGVIGSFVGGFLGYQISHKATVAIVNANTPRADRWE